MAVSGSGVPMVSYYDATNQSLKLAVCNTFLCFRSTIRVLQSNVQLTADTQVAVRPDGRAVISFSTAINAGIWVYSCSDQLCTGGAAERLVNGGTGATIAVRSDDLPVLAYAGIDLSGMRIYDCSDSLCTFGRDALRQAGAISLNARMVIRPDGTPLIGFYDTNGGRVTTYSCADPGCLN